jgi:hypothetical protein
MLTQLDTYIRLRYTAKRRRFNDIALGKHRI